MVRPDKPCPCGAERSTTSTYCKPCGAEAVRRWRKNNPHKAHEAYVAETSKPRNCADCGVLSGFYTGGKSRKRCRQCDYARKKEYRERLTNRDGILLRKRGEHYKKKYGLTLSDVEALLARFKDACGLCASTRFLCVDHDHATGAVRGILCTRCNTAVGFIETTSPTLVDRWRAYVTAPLPGASEGLLY